MPASQKARVFRNGRRHAVRIPAEYRFTTDEVFIERNSETGTLTLSEKRLGPSIDDIFRDLDAARAVDRSPRASRLRASIERLFEP